MGEFADKQLRMEKVGPTDINSINSFYIIECYL